jgi:hypothetical protein
MGDLKVTASVRKRGRRKWEALVLVANPRSGTARSSTKIEPKAELDCQNNLKQLALAAHSNVYGVPNPKKLNLSAARFFCQAGTTEQIAGAQDQLATLGLDAPGCFGRVGLFGRGLQELRFTIVCIRPVDGFLFTAQPGNAAADCLGPPGTFWTCGPRCRDFALYLFRYTGPQAGPEHVR